MALYVHDFVFLLLELSLEEKKHEYECQIRSLENEIRLLEDELTRRDLPFEDVKDDQLEQAMLVGLHVVTCTCSYMYRCKSTCND